MPTRHRHHVPTAPSPPARLLARVQARSDAGPGTAERPAVIDQALATITGQLNQALRRAFAVREDLAVLGHLLEQDGSVPPQVDNKLVVSLVNISRDTHPQRSSRPTSASGARLVLTPQPVYLNLSVMFAAHFSNANYTEALKFIAGTIGFFQSRPVFDRHNTPELGAGIERLVLDVANLDITELSNLWGILSGRYLPSVLYQVRMVSIDLNQVAQQVDRVRDARSSVTG